MNAKKRSVFRETALISGLVTSEDIQRALRVLSATREDASSLNVAIDVRDDVLAQQLVESGVITSYQAEQLKAGRTKLSLGPYLVTDWIAQGGMGQVFKAVHTMMGREVAIKVLPQSRSTPMSIASFTNEIRAQAQLDHENLVRAYDAGHDGNVYFLVTEFVPGTDLRRLIRSRGPLNMQQAASIISQAAHGLAHAHRMGLIHRDVKPGNILVTAEGRTKVSDLGLAGWLYADREDPRAGRVVGTADFIAPEQVRSPQEVTSVSDLYGLGCTLYYAVTGKVPYPGGKSRDKIRRHCEGTPWHPRRFNAEVSEDFADVIADMMEKDMRSRIQSAEEVTARLEPWCGEVGPISHQWSRSAWMAPPVPTTGEDVESSSLTSSDLDLVGSGGISRENSRVSQSSETLVPTNEQTFPLPVEPRTEVSAGKNERLSIVLLTLAIAVPVSMLFGSLITLLTLAIAK